MQETQQALEKFCQETHHKSSDFDSPHKITNLLKKYIATHVTLVEPSTLYPYISNDMKRVHLRMGGKGLGKYQRATMEPGVFAYLFSNVKQNYFPPIITQFQKDVLPRPPNEQRWEEELRKDKWKDLALFMTLNHKDKHNFRDIVNSIESNLTKDEFNNLCNKIYNWDGLKNDSVAQVSRELGELISSLEWPDVQEEKFYLVECHNNHKKKKKKKKKKKSKRVSAEFIFTPISLPDTDYLDWGPEQESLYRQEPVIREYKKQTQLTNQFPSRKAALQIIILGVTQNSPQEMESLLKKYAGKRQKHYPQVHPLENRKDWEKVLEVIDPTIVENVLVNPQANVFYNMMNRLNGNGEEYFENNQHFVKLFLTAHLMDWKEKWNGNLNKELIQTIERFRKRTGEQTSFLDIL